MRKLPVMILTAALAAGAAVDAQTGAAKKAASPKLPASAAAAMKSIDAERIRAHVRFLAHDLLEGRGTGQRGGDIAAEYIASQFALSGLKPAGEDNTYYQRVPLVGVTTLPQTTFTIIPANGQPMTLKHLDDYVATDQTQQPESDVEAEIVFVGYGIEAPEYKWDDYKNADLRGKALLMLVNEPPSEDEKFFKGKALTYYGRWTYKFEQAARKGAVAAILVHKTEMASYGWNVVRSSWSGESSFLKAKGGELKSAGWVQLEVARRLANAAGKDLDDLLRQAASSDFRPVPLPLKLKTHMVSKIRRFESNNVVAVLPGSDTNLKDEAVVYTAHYDHLGIRPERSGDNIYNGAADNATGTAVLLEVARAFAAAPQAPARSTIFAAVTAEEQGLRGSEYLGRKPPVPAGKITLNLNVDNVPPIGVPEDIEVTGAERTSFFPVVQTTARQFGLEIKPDSRPEAGHYYRSDHFSLARVGVPGFTVNVGRKFKGKTIEWGAEQARIFNEQRYHQPSDEYRPEMDFSSNAVIGRFMYALGWKAAQLPQLIAWEPGDEFEAARQKSQGEARGSH
jgi:Zn-dependent M28 family amino/carboxypeptidase